MTREEQIREAALAYSFDTDGGCTGDLNTGRDDFMEGAEWADAHPVNPWHDVKEELPNINIPVLVLTHSGNAVTTSMYIPRDVNGNILGDKEWKGNHAFKRSITHWMEIPQLPSE